MLNFDLNNDAVFAGTTGNGADLAVVVGRDHRCPPLRTRKPSGKRLATAYRTTPTATRQMETGSEDMSMSSTSSQSWQGQQGPAAACPQASVAPAIWAALIIQQAL